MGVFTRVSDIISANLNDIVERFEAPEAMLRQAIREIDSAVSRMMEATARAIADERLIERELVRHRAQSAELLAGARAAVGRRDETAARRALARCQEIETLAAALDDQLVKIRATTGNFRRQLDAMRVRRTEAQRTLHVLIARERAASVRRELTMPQDDCGSEVSGMSRFDRLRKKIERREAETDAFLELAGGEVEISEPDAGDEVELQLQAIKAELVAGGGNHESAG